jgi:predicted RNase H-like HicB family nuclease
MDSKTTTTTIRYRIEPKPGGGFVARAEEGPGETFEGSTREEVQQKIDDKLAALVGDMLHNDKVTEMVGNLLHKSGKIGGVNFQVNVTSKSSTRVPSQPAISAGSDAGIPRSSEPQFERSNKLWMVIALLVSIGAALMYFLKR